MTDRKDVVRPDPELEAWLTAARDTRAPEADYGAMLASLEGEIAKAEKQPAFWLRSRSTTIRRAVAIGAAFSMVAVALLLGLRGDFDAHPLRIGATLAALALLLALSAHQALRPIHRPPLPQWASAAIVALTIGATFAVALLAPEGELGRFPPAVSPCFFYGLLAGLPVYLVLRLLDRGQSGWAASLLGGCAAGLLGNLVLTLYCPSHDMQHLMFGHAGVAVLFVAGLALVHAVVRRR
jgi:hypothetical protein